MKNIILLHGIGNAQPGWSNDHGAHKAFKDDNIIEFNYEKDMEKTKTSWVFKGLVFAAGLYLQQPAASKFLDSVADYLSDIFAYLLTEGRMRKRVQKRLADLINGFDECTVIGHSMGSIVAYETLKNQNIKSRVTFVSCGSPLGGKISKIVKPFLRVSNNPVQAVKWINLHSQPNINIDGDLDLPCDVLSGEIIGLGCNKKNQYRLNTFHRNLNYYLTAAKALL